MTKEMNMTHITKMDLQNPWKISCLEHVYEFDKNGGATSDTKDLY